MLTFAVSVGASGHLVLNRDGFDSHFYLNNIHITIGGMMRRIIWVRVHCRSKRSAYATTEEKASTHTEMCVVTHLVLYVGS